MRHVGLKARMLVVGAILFAFYSAVALIGYALTGSFALVAVLTLGFVVFQYKFGKWAALRSVGAEDLPEDSQVHRIVEDLSAEMGIEKPRLMVAQMGVPNAFAVGRKGAGTVVVSRELMQLLDRDELEGVLAHELAHIRNRDVVMMVLGQSIASLVGIAAQFAVLFAGDEDLGNFIMAMVVGNITQMLALVFVFAISRYREYVADSDAADAIGSGDPLARALEKIESAASNPGAAAGVQGGRGRRGGRGRQQDAGVDDRVSALCIFGGERGLLEKVFATHPPVEKRIERLRNQQG
ncbi:MAG: M48 family metallopeptidase [Halobacteriaceae archaeon]